MRQLVGLSCVLCEKSIGSVIDGRFCASCGCPVHMKCVRPAASAHSVSGCSVCGAKPDQVQHEQALHKKDKQELAESGGLKSASEWTVLLARPESFHKVFALRIRDDSGLLEWKRGQISLIGQRLHEFKNVLGITLVRLAFPWLSLLVSNVIILGMSFGRIYSALTPENPLTWVALVVVDILLIWSTVSTRWIRVTYQSDAGLEETVYLLPVTSSGRRRFDGASERLLALLVNDVLEKRGEQERT